MNRPGFECNFFLITTYSRHVKYDGDILLHRCDKIYGDF